MLQGTKYAFRGNNCNNILVTDTDSNNVAVTVTDTSTKCNYMAGNGSLLWPSFHDQLMRFKVVCSSIPSLPTLCLKYQQIENNN